MSDTGTQLTQLTEVFDFVVAMKEQNRLPYKKARYWKAALQYIFKVLEPAESTVEFFLSNQRLIGTRAIVRWGIRQDTMACYYSRAKCLIRLFLSNKRDPSKPPVIVDKKPKQLKLPSLPRMQHQLFIPPTVTLWDFPLPSGGEFRFLPTKEMTVADVQRIAYHLMSFCKDFDPCNPQFRIVRTGQ